jgi:fatty-acyl-CoA synthase
LKTIAQSIHAAASRFRERDAIVIGARRLSHAAVQAEARRFAGALLGSGVRPGDHVGILMPNCIEYLLLFYACALIGARAVHFNSRYKSEELRYVIAHSQVKLLFVSAKQRELNDSAAILKGLYPALNGWRIGVPLEIAEARQLGAIYYFHAGAAEGWPTEREFMAAADGVEYSENTNPEEIALIMYTSGTTAHPKACMLSHRALEFAGQSMVARWRMTDRDRFWDPLPFFHMSTMLPLAACRASGAAFIAREHFDPGLSLREIADEKVSILFPAFPTLTNALFGHPDFNAGDLRRVRIVNNVGPPDLLRRFASRLPDATHVSAYGLTEAGGVISFGSTDDTLEERVETGGKPFEGVEVKIADPQTLAPKPVGEPGEILIRGRTLFSGYLNDPDSTRAAMAGGWLRSGDLGSVTSSGHIRYLGRIKDMLKVGGENVAAIEIESYLCTHPAIKVAQVVGAPDERLTEVPAAFIELKEGARVSAQEIIRYCKGRIASFKIPRYVYFVTDWPMSATKIQKFRLRDRIKSTDRIDASL